MYALNFTAKNNESKHTTVAFKTCNEESEEGR